MEVNVKVAIVVSEKPLDARGFCAEVRDANDPEAAKWPLAFAFGPSRGEARKAAQAEVKAMRRSGDL